MHTDEALQRVQNISLAGSVVGFEMSSQLLEVSQIFHTDGTKVSLLYLSHNSFSDGRGETN